MPADIFVGIRDKANSRLESQKTAVTLLNAIESLIKERKMEMVPVAYYGSLMSVLQQQLDEPENHREELIAIAQLMSILFPTLSVQVLRNQFTEISSALMELGQSFSNDADMSSAALDRYLLTCYAFLIAGQESASWNSSLINTLFQNMLVHLIDERPKVRKAAILSVRHVLSNCPAPLLTHPASNLVVRIAQHATKNREMNANGFIHIMAFLKDSWQFLNAQHSESIVDHLLKHFAGRMGSLDQNASHNLLAALDSFTRFMTEGGHWKLEKCNNFILFTVQDRPNINDTVGLACWLSLLKNAMTGLAQVENCAEKLIELLPKLYQRVFNYLQQTPHKQAHTKIAHEAIEETLQSFVILVTVEMVNDSLDSGLSGSSCVENIVSETEKGLGLQYQSGWSTVFRMIGHLIAKMGSCLKENPYAMKLMNSTLEVLAKDEVYAENTYFSLTEEFHEVIGIAIQSMGPAMFLNYFPLNLEAESKSRAWILPLLKENIKFGDLKYFIDYFIPLSIRIAQKGQQFLSSGKEHEGKTCAILWRQIWDLLPCFCSCPMDLEEAFDPLCQLIIPIVNSDDDRVFCVCEALRMVVAKNQGAKNLQHLSEEQIEANLIFISGFAMQLLPVLFNKYVTLFSLEEKKNAKYSIQQVQSVVSEAIKAWISIATVEVVDQFFQTTVKRYLELLKASKTGSVGKEVEGIAYERHAVFDLANAMIPSYKLSAEALTVFYKVLSMELTSPDVTIQKKAFKALASILRLRTDAEETSKIDVQRIGEIRSKLFGNPGFLDNICLKIVDTTMATELAAKKARLTVLCELVAIIDWQRPMQMQLIPAIVSEVILATKETNEKTRNIAYSLLVSMAHRFAEIESESQGQAEIRIVSGDDEMDSNEQEFTFKVNLEEYFKMIFAGFAGKTPFMISATIHACSRLLYEFNAINGDISQDLLESIVQSVLIFSKETKNREIIRAALGFLKVFIVACPDLLAKEATNMQEDSEMNEDHESFSYLQKTVEALLKWSGEHKSHFRVPCRHLVERIVRKCGLEKVEVFFPEDQKKLLANIRKKRQRALRKKEQLKSLDGSHQSFEDFMDDIEEEDEQNNASVDDDGSDEDLPQVLKEMVYGQSGRKPLKSALKLVEDDEDNPIDFLQTTGKVSTKNISNQDNAKNQRKQVSFEEKDGKLVITDSEHEDDEEELMSGLQRRIHEYKQVDTFKRSADGKKIKFSNKRTREDDEMQLDDDDVPAKRAETVKDGKFMSKKQKVAESEMKKAGISTTGKEYRSSKAKGDVKKEGKPDPFAYIPLNAKVVGSQKSRSKHVKVNKKLFYK